MVAGGYGGRVGGVSGGADDGKGERIHPPIVLPHHSLPIPPQVTTHDGSGLDGRVFFVVGYGGGLGEPSPCLSSLLADRWWWWGGK